MSEGWAAVPFASAAFGVSAACFTWCWKQQVAAAKCEGLS